MFAPQIFIQNNIAPQNFIQKNLQKNDLQIFSQKILSNPNLFYGGVIVPA